MAEKLEAPGEDDWEKMSVTIESRNKTERKTIEQIVNLIKEAWDNPPEQVGMCDPVMIEASRDACRKSLIHQADLILRQLIGSYMQGLEMNKVTKKTAAKKAAATKARILKDLENGAVSIQMAESDIENASRDTSSELFQKIRDLFHSCMAQC